MNIGAGTVPCTYDGASKHRTIIGDNVFIGSDTQLVAPVEVKSGATIGAGSTITRDVPADALTLSRAPQQTRPGWKRPVKQTVITSYSIHYTKLYDQPPQPLKQHRYDVLLPGDADDSTHIPTPWSA